MNCLECDAQIPVPTDAIQGEVVTCRDCNAAYELVREPNGQLLTLRPAETEGEDWGE